MKAFKTVLIFIVTFFFNYFLIAGFLSLILNESLIRNIVLFALYSLFAGVWISSWIASEVYYKLEDIEENDERIKKLNHFNKTIETKYEN